jgi:hypothetical protein
MRLRILLLVSALAITAPAVALAQDHAAACAAMDATAPAGWTKRLDLTAAGEDGSASAAALGLGQAAKATLVNAAEVIFPVAPQKTPAGETYAGLFELNIPTAGTYRLTLSDAAWVEVAKDGVLIASSAHAHGAPCTSVRKMVDFPLTAGRHVVEIAGAPAPSIVVMAAPVS